MQKVLRALKILFALACCLVAQTTCRSATTTREEQQGEDKFLVLENDSAKVVVFPAAGAAITEYLDKRTGINFAVGTVRKGNVGQGWADYTHLHPNDLTDKWVGALPHNAVFKPGNSYQAIIATCEANGLRFEREMRLDNDSAELTVLNKITNISNQPRGTWMRWHPYMQLDDMYARTSNIIVPGPDRHEIRTIPVGGGWDNHFMEVPGYWLAANYKSGVGMWMTFRKEQAPVAATWTDNRFSDHPKRGWFAAELMPKPILVAAGASTELACTYMPFVASDSVQKISMGFVAESDRAAAARFLKLVRGNLPVVSEHTMASPVGSTREMPTPENVFYFSHRRRDRFALTDWGIVDAMMSIPAVQSSSVRTRLYAREFDAAKEAHEIHFVFTMTDNLGKQVTQQKWSYKATPESRLIDKKEMIPLQEFSDGWYTFTLEAFDGDGKQPVHSYTERRKLVSTERAKMAEARRKDSRTLLERERPFVTALRRVEIPAERDGIVRVPIGVEEAVGTTRKQWPMRVGVPFAKGHLQKSTPVQLAAPDGKIVPIQTRPMGTWPDGSIRWLLVDFSADVPANSHVFYTLFTNSKAAPAQAALIRQEGDRIIIGSGANLHQFSANANGKLLGYFGANDLWWETGTGRRFEFRLQGDEAGVVIEENGPLRAVVKATGWYYEVGKAADKPIARGELRAEYYRGQSFHRLYHTVTYAGDPWQDTLGSFGLRFQLAGKGRQATVDVDGKAVSGKDQLSVRQVDENLALVKNGTQNLTGRHTSGAVSLNAQNGTTAVYLRDAWKMYPKKIEADVAKSTLTFDYWPKEAGDMDWKPREDGWISDSASINTLAVGVSRTHEFIIDETANPPLTAMAQRYDEPVLAVVPPRYLCATEALLHLQPYDPTRMPELEQQISETFDSYLLNQELYGWYGVWKYGSVPNLFLKDETRWADFGRYAFILNEQDICHLPWLAFLRSGDRKYFNFAEANTKHLLEVATIRLEPVWPQTIGMSHRHQDPIWLGAGDYGHSMLDPFLEYYHVTGYQPAWEASERMARGMAEQRDGSWRYISNPIAGLSRMYLETQQPFYKEQADRLWKELCAPDRNEWWLIDHGNRMVLYYGQLNDECKKLWNEWTDTTKDRFQGLDVLAAQYRRTGDIKYAKMALKHFREYQTQSQEYDFEREDPLRWSIGSHTQHILVHVREMCYASSALAAAQVSESAEDKAAAANAPRSSQPGD